MKNLYLTGAIILGVICVAIYVENIAMGSQIYFLGKVRSMGTAFWLLLFAMGGLGVLTTLYALAYKKEKELQDTNTFDLQ